jgi:hypothetical protein
VGFNVENDETIAFIPTGLKAVNVNYTTDVTTKTSGKLNAVAPATSGLSTNICNRYFRRNIYWSWKRSCNNMGQVGL